MCETDGKRRREIGDTKLQSMPVGVQSVSSYSDSSYEGNANWNQVNRLRWVSFADFRLITHCLGRHSINHPSIHAVVHSSIDPAIHPITSCPSLLVNLLRTRLQGEYLACEILQCNLASLQPSQTVSQLPNAVSPPHDIQPESRCKQIDGTKTNKTS